MVIFLIIIVTSSLVVGNYEATSKVSWAIEGGWPMSYLNLTRYHGPCNSNAICTDISIQGINVSMFVLDALIWYVIACFIAYGVPIIFRKIKLRQFHW